MTKNESSNEVSQAVLECQDRFWLALQRKDSDLFMEVLADDFVCRSPDQADQDRSTFIAALTGIPLTVLNINGEAMAVRVVGDVAVLTGTQMAQIHLPNGETISERLALTNVFHNRAGMWKMILAHPVTLPEKD